MSFLNPLIDFKKYSPFDDSGSRPFWSRVIDNRDPKMLGRIKCQIFNLLPFENSNQLPWIYPQYPIGIGQGPISGIQSIPEIDSYVLVIFPFNTIYFGLYIGVLNDRLRRLPDLLSEYPERYGSVDSLENKHIVNKAPRVNSTEQRWSDGTLAIHDSRESINIYTDPYGTNVYIDRKNQYLTIQFAGVKFNISSGRINIECIDIHFQVWRLFRVACKDILHLMGKTSVQIGGKLLGIMTKNIHTPNENDISALPQHTKRAKD